MPSFIKFCQLFLAKIWGPKWVIRQKNGWSGAWIFIAWIFWGRKWVIWQNSWIWPQQHWYNIINLMIGSSHEKKDIVWANKDIRFFYTALDVIQMGDLARSLIWQTNLSLSAIRRKKTISWLQMKVFTQFFFQSLQHNSRKTVRHFCCARTMRKCLYFQ